MMMNENDISEVESYCEVDLGNMASIENGQMVFTPRMYQLQVLQSAIERNTLAFLPTGSGKTLIAVLLIKRFLVEKDIETDATLEVISKQIIAFIAPTKVLVEQQRMYIAANCDAVVKSFTGSTLNGKRSRIEKWNPVEWINEIKDIDVMVVTPEILRYVFSKQFLSVSQFSLIIFDEVHHATGKSSMALLCDLIKESGVYPRILGMTASPVNSKTGTIHERIAALELRTQCKMAAAIEDVQELCSYNPKPELYILHYKANGVNLGISVGNAGSIINFAFIRARHAYYLASFAQVSSTLNMPLKDIAEIQGLNLPEHFDRSMVLKLDRLQQLLLQVMRIQDDCGTLCAIAAFALVLERDDYSSMSNQPSKWTMSSVNPERIAEQAQEVLDGPFSCETLLKFKRVCMLSLLECFIGFYMLLSDDIRLKLCTAITVDLCENDERSWSIMSTTLTHPDIQSLYLGDQVGGIDLMLLDQISLPSGRVVRKVLAILCRLMLTFITRDNITLDNNIALEPWITQSWKISQEPFDNLYNMLEGTMYGGKLLSSKVATLFSYLLSRSMEPTITDSSASADSCIVFCKMRLTSAALNCVFTLIMGLLGVSKLRCNYLVGSTTLNEQVRVLLDFKAGQFNILYASNVVEEGVDIKICSLVINFDAPETLKSLVQRRGRARSLNSTMIMMVERSAEGTRVLESISALIVQDDQLSSLVSDGSGTNAPSILLPPQRVDEYIVAATGAKADSHSAISVLYSHCWKFSAASPIFWSIRLVQQNQPIDLFQCAVLLPACFPSKIRCNISPPVTSKSLAKRLVALDCVANLHIYGKLDDWLHCKLPNKNITTAAARSSGGSSTAADVVMEEDEGEMVTMQVKYIADALLPSPQLMCSPRFIDLTAQSASSLDSYVGQGSLSLHLYSIVPSGEIPTIVLNDLRSASILACFKHIGLLLPAQLPSDVSSFPLKIKEKFNIDFSIHYLGEQAVSVEEMVHIQRFHRSILCWETLETASSTAFVHPEEWCESSNGAFYFIMPITLGHDDLFCWPSIDYLKVAADKAERLVHGLMEQNHDLHNGSVIVNYEIVHSKVSPILDDYLISHKPGFLSIPLQRSSCIQLSSTLMKKKGKQTTYFDYYVSKGVRVDALTQLQSSPQHKLLPVFGIGGKLTAEPLFGNLLEDEDSNGSEIHASTVSNLIPEMCRRLGPSVYFLAGLGLPCVLWRIQSLFLASECLDKIHELYDLNVESSSHPKRKRRSCVFPSTSLVLEAITPRMCSENIDSERLEMLGDSVCKLIIAEELYKQYPESREGHLTQLRSSLTCNDFQAKCAESSGLSKYLRSVPFFSGKTELNFSPPGRMCATKGGKSLWNMNIHMTPAVSATGSAECPVNSDTRQHCSTTVKSKRLADLVESLIGAFYLSGGIESGVYAARAMGLWPTPPSADTLPTADVPATVSAPTPAVTIQAQKTGLFIPVGYPIPLARLAKGEIDELTIYNEVKKSQKKTVQNGYSSGISKLGKEHLESKLGYQFKNVDLLNEALTHSSMIGSRNYERLEYLGDSVLDLAVVTLLFSSPAKYDQGQLSMYKSDFTNNINLGNLAVRLGLCKHIFVVSESLTSNFKDIYQAQEIGEQLSSIAYDAHSDANIVSMNTIDVMADCFEALIGAIYLDSGCSLEAITTVVRHCELVPSELISN